MKKLAILMSVVMLLTFTLGVAIAAEKKAQKVVTLSGDVVKVDAATGKITVKAKGKDITLTGEKTMLEGIAAGDKVTLEKSGHTLKSIKKTS
jgi:hypothetical protein